MLAQSHQQHHASKATQGLDVVCGLSDELRVTILCVRSELHLQSLDVQRLVVAAKNERISMLSLCVFLQLTQASSQTHQGMHVAMHQVDISLPADA